MKNNKTRKKYTRPAMKFYREGWNPVNYIAQFFRGVKHIYQRARYGYCDNDVFNMDHYLSALIGDMLNELADIAHGYPVLVKREKGLDNWKKSLRELAIHFYNTLEDYESEPRIRSEEAFDEYFKEYEKCSGWDYFDSRDETQEAKDLKMKWLNAENEADSFMVEEKDRALTELKEIYFHLWD